MAKRKNDDSTAWAFLGALLPIIGFVIVLLAKKDDNYAMYYAKHGLVLGIIGIILAIIDIIPVIGRTIYVVGGIILLVLWVIIFIAALSDEKKKFPVITELANKFNI